MTARVVVRDAAEQDLEDSALFIAREDKKAAVRFLDAFKATAALLAERPSAGRRRSFDHVRLAGLRSMPIGEFENFLIFYLPIERGIDIIRVLHGARDLEEALRR